MIFMECDTCKALPGSPPLCAGCLNNRTLISSLSHKHKFAVLTRDETVEIIGLLTNLRLNRAKMVDKDGDEYPMTSHEVEAVDKLRLLLCQQGSVIGVTRP